MFNVFYIKVNLLLCSLKKESATNILKSNDLKIRPIIIQIHFNSLVHS